MNTRPVLPGICAVIAASVAFLLPARFPEAMPQVAGTDLLSLVFADARVVLGRALLVKSDSYYHGGVDLRQNGHGHDCGSLQGNDHTCDGDTTVEGGGHGGGAHRHDPEDHQEHGLAHQRRRRDPWVWLNSQIHVQEIHHLAGEELAELMPWIWAACRADPHNTQAYAIGWYVLARMRDRPGEGIKILEEGIRNNPGSIELEFTRGQSLLSDLEAPAAAEEAFGAAREKALLKCSGEPAKLPEDDAAYLVRALQYLGHFAAERGDGATLRRYADEALAAAPGHTATQALQRMANERDPKSPRH